MVELDCSINGRYWQMCGVGSDFLSSLIRAE
jgi:hypothetical protein